MGTGLGAVPITSIDENNEQDGSTCGSYGCSLTPDPILTPGRQTQTLPVSGDPSALLVVIDAVALRDDRSPTSTRRLSARSSQLSNRSR